MAFLLAQMSEGQVEAFFSHRADVSSGDRCYVERWRRLNNALHLHEFISDSELTTFTYDDFLNMPRAEDLAYAINANPNGWKFLRSYFNFVHDRNGGAIHLTGDGGDEVFAVRPLYTADLLLRAPGRFVQHSWAYARLQNISPLKLMLDMTRLSRPAQSSDVLRAVDSLRHSEQGSNSWLTHTVRDQLIDFLQTHVSGLPKNVGAGDYDALRALRSAAQYTTMLRYYAGQANVQAHSPCLDNDVVKAVFSVPAYLRGDPEDYKKILSSAFKGIVPTEVLQRPSKGAYDEEVCRAMVQSSAVYNRILGESRLADMGIIEPRKISEALDRIDTRPMKTMWMLDRIMSIEGWIRSLETRQWLAAPNTKSVTVSRSSGVTTHKTTPALASAQFTVPRYIHALSSDSGAIVLFNQRTNMYHPLDVSRSNILRTIASAGNTEAVAERVIAAYPQTAPAVIRSDITRCLEEFQQLGVVRPTLGTHTRELPQTAGEIRLDANEDKTVFRVRANVKVPFYARLMVAAAFVLDKAASCATPGARLSLLQVVQRRWAGREATTEEAERLLHAAYTTPYFGRIACNEAPYTAALAAAMLRRKISWHQGVSFKPLTFHAWIEVGGKSIRIEREGKVAGRFQSFFEESR